MIEWRPTATREMLAHRSAVLMHARHFFVDRGCVVYLVDQPARQTAAQLSNVSAEGRRALRIRLASWSLPWPVPLAGLKT